MGERGCGVRLIIAVVMFIVTRIVLSFIRLEVLHRHRSSIASQEGSDSISSLYFQD